MLSSFELQFVILLLYGNVGHSSSVLSDQIVSVTEVLQTGRSVLWYRFWVVNYIIDNVGYKHITTRVYASYVFM